MVPVENDHQEDEDDDEYADDNEVSSIHLVFGSIYSIMKESNS